MTVKKFIELLSECNQSAQVVVPGRDHSYRRVGVPTEEQACQEGSQLSEWYSDQDLPDPLAVVVIR